ncbi:hypothetical protein HCU40_09210 [Pseudanabaena biceps]|nr:hypothetical protein [Pseudanabaena biceps]
MQSNYLPPLEPIGDFRSYVCGDVVIDQTAAIASGVLIQADQGGKILIAAGVCIGMGVVLHAQDGVLEICAGANLGAGVLVYGSSKIGEGACIGASSSIVRSVIAKGAIVPPCSLISNLDAEPFQKGDQSNPEVDHPSVETSNFENVVNEIKVDVFSESMTDTVLDNLDANNAGLDIQVQEQQEIEVVDPPNSSDMSLVGANSAQAKAHAQAQINRFIKRLYPQN